MTPASAGTTTFGPTTTFLQLDDPRERGDDGPALTGSTRLPG